MKKITNPFYNSTAWKKTRDNFKINNPLCKMCDDRCVVRVGKYIDHIIPIEIDYELRLDVDNLQNLCAKCHAKKTQAVDVQLLRGKEIKPVSSSDVDGIPTDSNHSWSKQI